VKPLTRTFISAVAAAALCAGGAAAQDQASPVQKVGGLVPLKVLIVIARYQGEKKVSTLPYTLSVNANDAAAQTSGEFVSTMARLRTGASVPVPSMGTPKESPIVGPVGPVQYKSIGTNIDCRARSTDDGRFRVDISIEDTSVYSEGQTAQGAPSMKDMPSFRTFQTSNAVILRDGQSTEFTAAADRITGDVTRVSVTVTVIK
jgi:hypothetical protein